jgi:PAS domain-containing protein
MLLKKEITDKIKDLLQKNPQGLSITDIVKEITINRNTAGRYLESLLVSGQVDMRRFGMAKIYMISQRVPLSAVLSISSDLIIQLDSSLRIIFANEPFPALVGTERKPAEKKY